MCIYLQRDKVRRFVLWKREFQVRLDRVCSQGGLSEVVGSEQVDLVRVGVHSAVLVVLLYVCMYVCMYECYILCMCSIVVIIDLCRYAF